MKLKVSILSALLVMLLVPTACGRTNEPYAQELMMEADDATLHVRIAGNPDAQNVLIAVHGGPGLSSSYMVRVGDSSSQRNDCPDIGHPSRILISTIFSIKR